MTGNKSKRSQVSIFLFQLTVIFIEPLIYYFNLFRSFFTICSNCSALYSALPNNLLSFLNLKNEYTNTSSEKSEKMKMKVAALFSCLFFSLILIFKSSSSTFTILFICVLNESVISWPFSNNFLRLSSLTFALEVSMTSVNQLIRLSASLSNSFKFCLCLALSYKRESICETICGIVDLDC